MPWNGAKQEACGLSRGEHVVSLGESKDTKGHSWASIEGFTPPGMGFGSGPAAGGADARESRA